MGTGGDKSFLKSLQVFGRLSDTARQWREKYNLTPTQALGRKGEDLAHRYLKSKGLEIVARRFQLADGSAEVDIIARERSLLVFVEVKTRRSAAFGTPERAIGPEKQRNLTRAARSYALRAGASWSQVRFDVIAIVLSDPPAITHYEDAFFPGRSV